MHFLYVLVFTTIIYETPKCIWHILLSDMGRAIFKIKVRIIFCPGDGHLVYVWTTVGAASFKGEYSRHSWSSTGNIPSSTQEVTWKNIKVSVMLGYDLSIQLELVLEKLISENRKRGTAGVWQVWAWKAPVLLKLLAAVSCQRETNGCKKWPQELYDYRC